MFLRHHARLQCVRLRFPAQGWRARPSPHLPHPPPPTHAAQIPVAFGVALLASGATGACLLFFGLAGLAAFCFRLWRDQIQLATKLLGVSAHALAANSGVVTTTLLLNLGGLLAIAPLGVLTGKWGWGGGLLRLIPPGSHAQID